LRAQNVLKIFLAEQIKPVTTNPTQDGMHEASGKDPVRCVKKGTQNGLQKDGSAPNPALSKGLGIPGKES
jgi:hypothetical protein